MWHVKTVLVLLLVVVALKARADEIGCEQLFAPASGSYGFTEQANRQFELSGEPRISKVHVTNLDVFDEANPRESNPVYRFLNRIHVNTRAGLIKNVLLFQEGDAYEPRLIDESARLLRSRQYLYDADIRPVSRCGDDVAVEVITRDVWSLTIDASFDRSGGENNFGLGIRDTNLMGTGTELSLKTKQDIDRDSTELSYKNDNLRGSRLKTRLRYADNDDGSDAFALLELPFYSLDATRAWTLSFRENEKIDEQFFRGDEVTEVRHDHEDYRVAYGLSNGLQDGVTRRWYLGWWHRNDRFSPGEDLPPPDPFPEDRELSFPYVEFSSIEDKYEERVNLYQFERIEDLHVGRQFYTRLGYSDAAFGGNADRFVFEGAYRDTLLHSARHLFVHSLTFSGLHNFDTDRAEDLVMNYRLRYIVSPSKYRSYLADFRTTYTKNLNTNQQIFMGGENYLRAFDNRFQVGDRSFALNLERRTYTDIHLFNLVRVGWAFFVDIGRAWDPDVDTNFEDDYLANVGFGLRLASSKSDAGRFLHIDVAFPLTNRNDPDVDSSLVSVRLADRF